MVGHEAMDPSAGGRVNPKAGKGVNCERGVEMVKKTRDVEEEDCSDLTGSDSLFCLVVKGSGGVWCRVVCTRAKLTWSQQVKMVDVRAKVGGDNLLEQLPTALEEGDRPVCFSSGIAGFMGFGYDGRFL